jgi:hypothetical protein
MKAPLSLRRKFRDAIRRSYQGAKFPDSIEMSEVILRCRQALLTCVALAISLTIMNAKNLDELRWKERVILIYAPKGSEKQLGRQEALLRLHDVELTERDITQIVVRAPAENPEIAKRFKLSDAGFSVLLIGKDGGEKLRSHEIVSPETLCRLIDSMPMRKEEMRERASASRK